MPNLRRLGVSKRRAWSAPRRPRAIELEFYQEIKRVLLYARGLIKARLLPELKGLVARMDGDRQDAMPPSKKVNRIMERVRELLDERFPNSALTKIGDDIGKATAAFEREQLLASVRKSLGISLETITDAGLPKRIHAFSAENVALIRSIPEQYFTQVEALVLAGMRQGERPEVLEGAIAERFDVSDSRATVIARDQISKFGAELDRARFEQLGADQYVWRTVHDERVRSVHAEFDGNVYSWDDPPGDGSPHEGTHPGTGVLCRCWADPIFEDTSAQEEG